VEGPVSLPLVPWVHGHTIRAHLLAVNFTGLTGPLTFDPSTGQRAHYRLDVMALRFDDPLHKVVAQRFLPRDAMHPRY